MKERKIGEVFEYNGEWYQCVKSPDGSCKHCDMNCGGKCPIPTKECMAILRSDLSYVIFKKLEKVGEPYEKRVSDDTFSTFQRYKVYNSVILPKKPYMYYNSIDSTIEIEIEQNKENMEEKKLNLKPFDLEAAKAGKTVCTRDGRKARIICFDRESVASIVALIRDNNDREEIHSYYEDGKSARTQEYRYDLMMLPEKKEEWVNIYEDMVMYTSEEEAKMGIATERNYIATAKVEWEE